MAKKAAQHPTSAGSYQQAIKRFSAPQVASEYPAHFRSRHWRDRREKKCIMKALRNITPGSRLLDLPCGTGRLTRLLMDQGFRVTAADVSEAMVNNARTNIAASQSPTEGHLPHVDFEVRDVMQTGYADDQFDAIVCNRLFHHFTESSTRLRALKELRRISRGPVIISFFNSFALDATYRRIVKMLRRRTPKDRIPIPYTVFHGELQASGFRVQQRIAVRWGISPQWYVVAV
jgi:2-polyprenyl-3-methyl-5-hydroxy-6-metoxy-1,4-benzoquinol methylase